MKKNKLSLETSPYLKQHENNPVDWFPWGEEALEKSKREDKPILLSVGYSACHWCHVMAHECFENAEIASIMNEHYVCIKVDREERPDLDQIYQPVAQLITHGGGWPLTVFLTPDLSPFYGGTYFPPTDRYGKPGFSRLLVLLSEAFRNNRADIIERAARITDFIKTEVHGSPDPNATSSLSNADLLKESTQKLLNMVDWENGGFGGAPKFPNPMPVQFLWRMSQWRGLAQEQREKAQSAVLLTLEKMARGGVFDQLGGGFHRYSVDAHWSVPHFEKMLYDNGLLLRLYSEVLLSLSITHSLTPEQKSLFTETVVKTVHYVDREMISPLGLFYAAQDADSLDQAGHSEEGAFFVWDREEISTILGLQEGARELDLFCDYYGITENGNFEHGKTVLFQTTLPPAGSSLAEISKKVFLAREKRARPSLDDKSLTSWNALMISGLVWASLALKDLNTTTSTLAKTRALAAYQRIKELAMKEEGRLSATIQQGQPRFEAYLDDYAFLAWAALDLARIDFTQAAAYWADAQQWMRRIWTDFKDQNEIGFFFTRETVALVRPKTFFDQAIPAGNSVCNQLFQLSSDPILTNKMSQELEKLKAEAFENPYGKAELLNALLLQEIGPVVFQGSAPQTLNIPYCFFEKAEGISGQTQYCHGEVCKLTASDISAHSLVDLLGLL